MIRKYLMKRELTHEQHICKYCGTITTMDDEDCYKNPMFVLAQNYAKDLYGKVHYLVKNRPHKNSNAKLTEELCLLFVDEVINQNFGDGYNHKYWVAVRHFITDINRLI